MELMMMHIDMPLQNSHIYTSQQVKNIEIESYKWEKIQKSF